MSDRVQTDSRQLITDRLPAEFGQITYDRHIYIVERQTAERAGRQNSNRQTSYKYPAVRRQTADSSQLEGREETDRQQRDYTGRQRAYRQTADRRQPSNKQTAIKQADSRHKIYQIDRQREKDRMRVIGEDRWLTRI